MAQLRMELAKRGFRDAFNDAFKRKIRFFIEKKLIDPPEGTTASARYGENHLLRILAIWKLRRKFWRIDDVRDELGRMSHEELKRFALGPEPEFPGRPVEESDREPSQNLAKTLTRKRRTYRYTEAAVSPTLPSPQSVTNKAESRTGEVSARPEGALETRKNAIPIESVVRQEFECDDINGHILAVIGEERVLLDTAFPRSFGECQYLTICGKRFEIPPSEPQARMTAPEISDLIETHLTVFLGSDVLNQFDFIVDLEKFRLVFAEEMEIPEGAVVPIKEVNGLPTAMMKLPDGEYPFCVSTGSKLSFLHSSIVGGFPVIGTDHDYIPRYGKLITKVRKIPVNFGGKSMKLTFGSLPPIHEEIYEKWGILGIIGTELFMKNVVMFSNKRKKLVIIQR